MILKPRDYKSSHVIIQCSEVPLIALVTSHICTTNYVHLYAKIKLKNVQIFVRTLAEADFKLDAMRRCEMSFTFITPVGCRVD